MTIIANAAVLAYVPCQGLKEAACRERKDCLWERCTVESISFYDDDDVY